MSDDASFKIGIVLGVLAGLTLFAMLSYSDRVKYTMAIQECEKSLPRDKHCKVIGVVDDSPKAN